MKRMICGRMGNPFCSRIFLVFGVQVATVSVLASLDLGPQQVQSKRVEVWVDLDGSTPNCKPSKLE